MTHKVNTTWKENLQFDAFMDDHMVKLDTSKPLGDNTGPRPKLLLLASLASCTGIDVVSLLKKMRVEFTGLDVSVEGDLTDDYPIVYSELRVTYTLSGNNIDRSKVEKAVGLSRTKYCGVSIMLKKHCPIHYSIVYIDE